MVEARRERSSSADPVGSAPLAPLLGAGLVVPLVGGGEVPYVNLDYAASTPALAQVARRVETVLPWYSSVHRGAGYTSLVSTSLYESARKTLGAFVGARPDDVVVLTRNTTDSLNLLASALPPGSRVVHLDVEHHADLLPWQRGGARALRAGSTLEETIELLEKELASGNVALVAVTGASNVTGEVLPVGRLAELAHSYGARLALDAAQLAPHRRIDLAALGADYLSLSGHKCYAPYGAGLLVGRRDWRDEAPAHLAGGGAVREVGLESTTWADSPARHEGGTPNLLGAVALAEASRALEAIGPAALAAHEAALRARLVGGLEALGPAARRLSIWPDSPEAIGVVAFEMTGFDSGLVGAYLSCEHGIGVRDGRFCAHPLLERLTGGRPALRASVGVGSCLGDVERLLDALGALVSDGPSLRYRVQNGNWVPERDDRPVPFAEVDLTDPELAPPCKG